MTIALLDPTAQAAALRERLSAGELAALRAVAEAPPPVEVERKVAAQLVTLGAITQSFTGWRVTEVGRLAAVDPEAHAMAERASSALTAEELSHLRAIATGGGLDVPEGGYLDDEVARVLWECGYLECERVVDMYGAQLRYTVNAAGLAALGMVAPSAEPAAAPSVADGPTLLDIVIRAAEPHSDCDAARDELETLRASHTLLVRYGEALRALQQAEADERGHDACSTTPNAERWRDAGKRARQANRDIGAAVTAIREAALALAGGGARR